MRKILFIFLDGVGLGAADPLVNPFAHLELPTLHGLLGGRRLLAGSGPLEEAQATLVALDATLGVPGLPQSATGQATLLTGVNVPAAIGMHYGPKPNPAVAAFLAGGGLFGALKNQGKGVALLNAYPPRYFAAIQSGRRLYSAIPLAVTQAGLVLKSAEDLYAGQALSADFTAQGWRDMLGLVDTPILTPRQAGQRLGTLAAHYDFAFFEYWLSDYAGHRQDMVEAGRLLVEFDEVLGGLLAAWNPAEGLILITSDHGNLEDLSTRRHTYNPVPALLVGDLALRREFAAGLHDLAGIAPAIQRLL